MTPYQKIEPFLTAVKKPARYTGGEYNSVIKDPKAVDLRVAFCFPDTYEIGMSCLGLRILYDVINRLPYVWCERVFAPWEDMRALLLRKKVPLYALESGGALTGFDVLAFSLQYELSYTNVLSMLDLAGIPLRSAERDETHPYIIAGGPCAYHPEPLADFIDLFAIGEGEEVIVELMELLRKTPSSAEPPSFAKEGTPRGRQVFLEHASNIPGVYVPSVGAAIGRPVAKRIVHNLDNAPYPDNPIAASTEIVHDRVMLELFRGCARGCRFCSAGHTSRPLRVKSPETLAEQAKAAVENSGAGEIGLVSLSTSDYPGLEELCNDLVPWCKPRRAGLSLPSLRADSFHVGLLQKTGRKSGLTFAPEAGSARLRNVINKNLNEPDLISACAAAFNGGWNGVKLYFMLGLPTETDEDVQEIAALCDRIWRLSKGVRVTASASCFVPKPHTPFQWEPMVPPAELLRRAGFVKERMRRQVTFHWHEPDTAYLECALARGDRRLGAVVERAYRSGCRMDGWSECFSMEKWRAAFAAEGIDPDFYTLRRRSTDEILPWSHISTGVSAEYLKREREKAYRGEPSADCRNGCEGCGISCGRK
jgi:radical SAM family uncharacterized protein